MKLHGQPIVINEHALLHYDFNVMNPKCVYETLDADLLELPREGVYESFAIRLDHDKYDFFGDTYKTATFDNINANEFHKGHIAAAGNYKSDRNLRRATCVYPNISPMYAGFNCGNFDLI